MGRNTRGRGSSSAPRGRGRASSCSSIGKTSSSGSKRSTNLLKLPSNYVPARSPIRTRGLAALANPDQPGTSGLSTNKPGTSSTAVPTSNGFAALSDDNKGDDDDDVSGGDGVTTTPSQAKGTSTAGEQKSKKSNKKMPPITVPGRPAVEIEGALADADCQYLMRINKSSVNIITRDRPRFEKVLKTLKDANIQYYTHDSPENLPVKVVVTGFSILVPPKEFVDVILAKKNIYPREAKVLSHKVTEVGDQILWLLYFERGSVKIQDLRKVKSLEGFMVSWRYFSKRPSDAAQCHRCQRFGHGSRNCTLAPKCVKCSAAHLTAACTLPKKASLGKDNQAEQNKRNVKCANCDGNHTANYRGCTARKTYLEALEKRKKPAPHSSRTSTGQPSTEPRQTNPPGFGRTYASVAATANGPTPDSNSDGDLFTLTEFLSLARDMFTRLNTCRNKLEQFFALQELMGKYLCPA